MGNVSFAVFAVIAAFHFPSIISSCSTKTRDLLHLFPTLIIFQLYLHFSSFSCRFHHFCLLHGHFPSVFPCLFLYFSFTSSIIVYHTFFVGICCHNIIFSHIIICSHAIICSHDIIITKHIIFKVVSLKILLPQPSYTLL